MPVRMRQFPIVFGLLFGAWCLLSGMFDAFHLGVGLLASLALAALACKGPLGEPFPVLRFLAFVPWQIVQIVRSNLRVARLMLSRRLPSSRFLVRKIGVRSDWERALLGCAITQTPGTLTVEMGEDEMVVHALDEASARDIEDDVMARKVSWLFDGGGA